MASPSLSFLSFPSVQRLTSSLPILLGPQRVLNQLLAIVNMSSISSPERLQNFTGKNFLNGNRSGGSWAARVALRYLHLDHGGQAFAAQVAHPLKWRCREMHPERQQRGRRKRQEESWWPFPFGANQKSAKVLVKQMSDP